MPVYVLATVPPVLVQVQTIAVQQMLLYALVIVMSVLVLVQHITVQQAPAYVLATVMCVQVLVQHITVQQVMPYVLIRMSLVTVQPVTQCLIVNHVLTLMVYADIQHAAVILAAMRTIMVLLAPPATFVAVALVLAMC